MYLPYFLIFHEKAIGVTVFPGGGKPYLGNVAFFLGNVSGNHHRSELWLIFSPPGSLTIWHQSFMFSSPINFLYYHVHAASSGQSWGKLSINLYLSPPPANITGRVLSQNLGDSQALWPWEISWLTLFAGRTQSAHVFSDSRRPKLIFTCNWHWFLISWSDDACRR